MGSNQKNSDISQKPSYRTEKHPQSLPASIGVMLSNYVYLLMPLNIDQDSHKPYM